MEITDSNLIAELKIKNQHALEYIIDVYGKSLYMLVKRILYTTGNNEDIEECVSDAFVQAWERINGYDESKGSLRTWLFMLAKYRALDYRRKLGKSINTELIEDIDHYQGEVVEDELLVKEQLNEVVERINKFEEPDRSIFLRRYFLYESVESIAQRLGFSEGAVYKRLWRSRNVLKKGFMKEDDVYGQ
jgi:RNA polymerase sigma-70 factor (ECF subfamily)